MVCDGTTVGLGSWAYPGNFSCLSAGFLSHTLLWIVEFKNIKGLLNGVDVILHPEEGNFR